MPDGQFAPIGHNSPPPYRAEILEAHQKKAAEFLDAAGEWLDLKEIGSAEQASELNDFIAGVKERALDTDVLKSLTPGQQVIKIVHEELTALMGGGSSRLAFAGRPPTVVLLCGLQGSGKTTTAAKLALQLRRDGRSPAIAACDLARPAAIDQLEQLGRQIQVP